MSIFGSNACKKVSPGDQSTPSDLFTFAKKIYVNTRDALQVAKADDTMTGHLSMCDKNINRLADPSKKQDAATKTM